MTEMTNAEMAADDDAAVAEMLAKPANDITARVRLTGQGFGTVVDKPGDPVLLELLTVRRPDGSEFVQVAMMAPDGTGDPHAGVQLDIADVQAAVMQAMAGR